MVRSMDDHAPRIRQAPPREMTEHRRRIEATTGRVLRQARAAEVQRYREAGIELPTDLT